MAQRIVLNRIQCNKCNTIIESRSVHDFKFCKCKAVAVDGGLDYCRRVGNFDDYKELSIEVEDIS